MKFEDRISFYQKEIEDALISYLPNEETLQGDVVKAMKYSLLNAGKRVRPILTLEFCRICSCDYKKAVPFACAIEMIHTYSLIHDDLPCLDNDDLRRGKPSCHIVFGEDIALLAGDGLLNLAFETALKAVCENPETAPAAYALAYASGTNGMIGGQVIDVQSEGKKISLETMQEMHTGKTGALIRAAAAMGVIIGGNNADNVKHADDYAINLGIAFQIIDDILDCCGDEKLLGKHIGSDAENNKSTYVSLLGIDEAKKQAESYTSLAKKCLEFFGDKAEFLNNFTDLLLKRNY